ncbi:MAG: hypothetical protein ABJA37_04225 [Ferruginibacter sp.]
MKKAFYFSLGFLMLIVSCSKPKDFYNEVGKGAYLTLVKTNNILLNAVDQASSVGMVVNSVGSPVASVNIYVSSINTLDQTKWKLIKNVPFSGATTLSVTNAQIATALGLTPGNLDPGSVFFLYNEVVTKDGRKFSTANTSSADLESQLAFNVASTWTATVICPFDAGGIAGSYSVVQDDWDGYSVGDMVQVTAGPGANQVNLSQVYPNGGAVVSPLLLDVEPATGAVSIATGVTFGDYGAYKAITGAGSSGFVFSCTNQISIKIHIIAPPFGDQGFFQLILQK